MYESEYSPAVRDFITWIEANSTDPESEIEAVKSGANLAVENTTGSDDDFDNGLEEVTNEWEAAPGLAPKLAEIAYNAQWDTSLCHTAEFFVDREEFNDNGDRLEYTKSTQDAAQVLYNYARVWYNATRAWKDK